MSISYCLQEELYKVLHGILVNSGTREAAMHYIATALNRNARKSQIQVVIIFCHISVLKNLSLQLCFFIESRSLTLLMKSVLF